MFFTSCRHQEEGLSLIEVMVGIAILSIALIPILNYFAGSTRMVNETKQRSIALNLAQNKIENLKSIDFVSISDETEDYGEIDINNDNKIDYPKFKRKTVIEEKETDIKEVIVTVFWKKGSGGSIKLQTLIVKR